MGRPSKSVENIRKHLTLREKEQRDKAEKSLVTGHVMRPSAVTRADPVALSTWKRVNTLLGVIEKNDALFEVALNRYCLIVSRIYKLMEEDGRLAASLAELEEHKPGMDYNDYLDARIALTKAKQTNLNNIMKSEALALNIEKENAMTLAAQLRAVPKAREDESEKDETAQFMARRANGWST